MTQEETPPAQPLHDPVQIPPPAPAAFLPPSDFVRIGNEQPLRMTAITGSRLSSSGPVAPARRSAVAAYEAAVSFDWRNQPLAGPGRGRS